MCSDGQKYINMIINSCRIYVYHFPDICGFQQNIYVDEEVLKTSKTSFNFSKHLQEILIKTNIFALVIRLQKRSSRCCDPDQCICLGHTSSRYLQNVFQRGLHHNFKTFSRGIFKLNCSF